MAQVENAQDTLALTCTQELTKAFGDVARQCATLKTDVELYTLVLKTLQQGVLNLAKTKFQADRAELALLKKLYEPRNFVDQSGVFVRHLSEYKAAMVENKTEEKYKRMMKNLHFFTTVIGLSAVGINNHFEKASYKGDAVSGTILNPFQTLIEVAMYKISPYKLSEIQ